MRHAPCATGSKAAHQIQQGRGRRQEILDPRSPSWGNWGYGPKVSYRATLLPLKNWYIDTSLFSDPHSRITSDQVRCTEVGASFAGPALCGHAVQDVKVASYAATLLRLLPFVAMVSCEINKTDMSNFKPAHARGGHERAKVFIKSECQLASMCATKLTMHMSLSSKDLQVEMHVIICIFTQPWVIGHRLLQYRLVANVPVKTRFASSWTVGSSLCKTASVKLAIWLVWASYIAVRQLIEVNYIGFISWCLVAFGTLEFSFFFRIFASETECFGSNCGQTRRTQPFLSTAQLSCTRCRELIQRELLNTPLFHYAKTCRDVSHEQHY